MRQSAERGGEIVRRAHDKQNPYVMISRALCEDETLSLEARGLMCYLLAKPPAWQVRMADLRRTARVGRDQMQRIVKELESAGYIVRTCIHGSNGRWQWESVVYEVPQSPLPENPVTVNPVTIAPLPDNPAIYQVTTVPTNKRTKEPTEPVPVNDIDPNLRDAIRTWAYQHRARLTEAQIATLAAAAGTLARWQQVSAGAGSLAAVQRALEG